MKKSIFAALTVAFVASSTSHAITHTLSGPMDVFQATTNPSNVGIGSGLILGDYDDSTNILNYNISWMNLTSSVTNMHFHLGAPGVPGGIELAIPGPWTSPEIGSGIVLSGAQETNLLSGDWYVNVHTSNFGSGEIRGQVLVSAIPEPTTAGLAAMAFISMFSIARFRR